MSNFSEMAARLRKTVSQKTKVEELRDGQKVSDVQKEKEVPEPTFDMSENDHCAHWLPTDECCRGINVIQFPEAYENCPYDCYCKNHKNYVYNKDALSVPEKCLGCTDFPCHTCEYGSKHPVEYKVREKFNVRKNTGKKNQGSLGAAWLLGR